MDVDENGVLFHRLNIDQNEDAHVPDSSAHIFLFIIVRLSVQSLTIIVLFQGFSVIEMLSQRTILPSQK